MQQNTLIETKNKNSFKLGGILLQQ